MTITDAPVTTVALSTMDSLEHKNDVHAHFEAVGEEILAREGVGMGGEHAANPKTLIPDHTHDNDPDLSNDHSHDHEDDAAVARVDVGGGKGSKHSKQHDHDNAHAAQTQAGGGSAKKGKKGHKLAKLVQAARSPQRKSKFTETGTITMAALGAVFVVGLALFKRRTALADKVAIERDSPSRQHLLLKGTDGSVANIDYSEERLQPEIGRIEETEFGCIKRIQPEFGHTERLQPEMGHMISC
jgi:hypothetical protein